MTKKAVKARTRLNAQMASLTRIMVGVEASEGGLYALVKYDVTMKLGYPGWRVVDVG